MTLPDVVTAPAHLRIRDFATVGPFSPGPTNSMVDVAGARVGHVTVNDAAEVFTGVSALTFDGVSPRHPVPAGLFVGNGYGKLVGATQIAELGQVETPIILTSTLAAFRAADAVLTWVLRTFGDGLTSINAVVGEINDSWLSDHRARPITSDHVLAAIESANPDAVAMGNVGGGTGACALGFKGGIGSSSRLLDLDGTPAMLGALVQANMDGDLRVLGRTIRPVDVGLDPAGPDVAVGSCVVVIAIDLPLSERVLERVAARAIFALARVGSRYSHGSGDYALAISTSHSQDRSAISDGAKNCLFEATMDAVEEAIIDALLAASTVTTTSGRTASSLPLAALLPAAVEPVAR